LITGAVDVGGSLVVLYVNQYSYVYLLLATHTLFGLTNLFFAMSYAYLADITVDVKNRSKNFGIAGAAFGFSMMSGPAVMGFIAGQYSFAIPLFVALGLTIVDIFYVAFLVAESKVQLKSENVEWRWRWSLLNPFHSFRSLLLNRLTVISSVVYFITNFSEGFADVLVVFWKLMGFDPFQIGVLYSVMGLCWVISQGIVIRLVVPRLGDRISITLSEFINFVSISFYAVCKSLPTLIPVFVFRSLSLLVYPTLSALISKQFAPQDQGQVLGALNAVQNLGQFLGPLLFNNLFSFFISSSAPTYLPGAPFYAAAVTFFMAFALCAVFYPLFNDQRFPPLAVSSDGETNPLIVNKD